MVLSPSFSVQNDEVGTKPLGKIHILEDATVYSQYTFHDMIHRVNGGRHPGSIYIEYFIDSLESFMRAYEPWRAYSMMVGTTRPTSMMKAFVDPPRPPLICAWVGLDRLPLVELD